MNRLDEHTEIVTEHLAQHLIELPDITLAPYRIPELALIMLKAVSTFDRLW